MIILHYHEQQDINFFAKNPKKKDHKSVPAMRDNLKLRPQWSFPRAVIIIIIINALFFYGDHVTHNGDFQRTINDAIYIYTHG